ncbi:hypothetical protein S40293_01263 [Stachybotrys chartarum IBT 40293]|nr:hypothetical protein S40293_01263 [Stachybotrys chartarum IBT 40293]
MHVSSIVLSGALAAGVSAQNYLGFNSGATLADRSAKFKEDYLAEFRTAQNLRGAPGKFNAVRLYTNIQAYSESDPISAFEAAIETDTSILLGVWASGTNNIDNEIAALRAAIDQYGSDFTDLVIGISIGSEDLYRVSETGVINESGVGAGPDVLVRFIEEYREAFADTPLADVPVGHVDTWDVWGNSSNRAVIEAVDFIGVDEYPYYENDKGNDISNSGQLFDRAYQATLDAAGGKPVWVTETGWPTSGPDWDEAEASIRNAKYYWNEVGCRRLFNQVPTFWYNLRDSNPDNEMKFAITENLSTTPMFNLTCPTTFQTPDADEEEEDDEDVRPSGSATTTVASTTTAAPTTSSTSGSGSGSGSGSDEDDSDSDSGSGSGSESGSGSGSGTTPGAPSPTNSGSSEEVTPPASGAMSGKMLSTMTYGGLALVAGVFALM